MSIFEKSQNQTSSAASALVGDGGVAETKYGDADVCSKRRKQAASDTGDDDHASPSYEHFALSANVASQLHSSLLCDDNDATCSGADFKGGLLLTDAQPAMSDLTVSTQPSLTSKGFENTFKLLENRVRHNTLKTSDLLQSIMCDNTFNSSSSSLFTIRESAEEEAPTRLDLELGAMQRLQNYLNTHKVEERRAAPEALGADAASADTSGPLLSLLYDFASKGLRQSVDQLTEDEVQQSLRCLREDLADESALIYHAARGADGRKFLKVVRKLLLNKVLCGNRVSQMTRAYDDIEAVTRLLEEKEKDLELTVQIGKELLTQNNTLENRIGELEADLKESNDDRAQLVHELSKKNELISVLTNDADDGSEAGDTPTFSKVVTLDLLQRKITTLQDENKSLKQEATQLAHETDAVEEHERRLMADINAQLSDANSQFDNLNLELERHREENRLQHEQIVSLTARLAEAEMRLHQLSEDNDGHMTLLNITKENQNSLALELVEFKQRYQEVLALLHEAQEQLRRQRKKSQPMARSSFLSGLGSGSVLLQPDSLQSELMESSMYSEQSMDSGISLADGGQRAQHDRIGRLMAQLPGGGLYSGGVTGQSAAALGAGVLPSMATGGGQLAPPYRRVFETVRCVSKNANYADGGSMSASQLGATMSMSSSSGPRMSAMASYGGGGQQPMGSGAGSSNRNSLYDSHHGGMGLGLGVFGGQRTLSMESLASQSDDGYPSQQPAGVPGAPGAKDLEAALKRLTPAEVLARRAMLSYAPAGTYSYDDPPLSAAPLGIRTPDSIMSTGSSLGLLSAAAASSSTSSSTQWRLPDKLQIVKPLEGSQTLHHWSRLATPTLSGLLDERPGVTIRGGRGLDELGLPMYTLSDVEEDVPDELLLLPPGKQYEAAGYTYTITNSLVMHPDDGLVNDLSFLSQSQMSSRMASTSTSRNPSCPPTPRAGLSRKNSCSTFSVNLGLASMLNERGIKAVTPSALNTPAGPNFTPTGTPCNSPEGSPTRSMSPEPLFGLLSSGADLIRRKLVGGDVRPNRSSQQKMVQMAQQQKILLSRLERRALRSLKLVEKVESIGLENIIATQPSTVTQLASGIANRSSSPMAQLTSLQRLHTSTNSIVDDLHFDRDQIKDVLHRGLKSPTTRTATGAGAGAASSSSSAYNSDSDEAGAFSVYSRSSEASHSGCATAAKAAPPALTAHTAQRAPHGGGAPHDNSSSVTAQQKVAIADIRTKQMQRQKSRRNLKNGLAAQRPDLGTIGGGGGGGGRMRSDLGRVSADKNEMAQLSAAAKGNNDLTSDKTMSPSAPAERTETQSLTQAFVGTVSSLLFGRKGGWL